MRKEDLINILEPFGQQHLVRFWDDLDTTQREQLLDEIEQIDFAELCETHKATQKDNICSEDIEANMSPIPNSSRGSYQNSTEEQLKSYESQGLKAIANREVAVLLLAGGQGSRLGVSYPKGMYSVNLPSNKTLFQIQAERLIRIQELAQNEYNNSKPCVPWYIMTSENTKDTIIDFFERNSYFSLEKENVTFFEQGTLPCLTKDGKIFLDEKHKISRAPNGNGGLYRAIEKFNILDDMRKRGIKYIHIYCVDNILIRIADPIFIGFSIEKSADCAAKVVKKTMPEENVGVICKVNDKYQVVEYSEISEANRNKRDENGDLSYNAGNICNHFLTIDFLTDICKYHETSLKYHVAEKKISYVDENGLVKKPISKNGIKLEKFIFDIFPFSKNFVIWEVVRREEFSPLKNGLEDITDNPVTCRKDILNQHKRWLENVDIKIENANLENDDETPIDLEISPLVSYSGEGLEFLNGKKLVAPVIIEMDKNSKTVLFNGMNWTTYQTKNNLI